VLLDEPEAFRPLVPELPDDPPSESDWLLLDEPLRPLSDSPLPCDDALRSEPEPLPVEPLCPLLLLPDEPEVFWSRSAMISLLILFGRLPECSRGIPRALRK
jgi:hypothetical protein